MLKKLHEYVGVFNEIGKQPLSKWLFCGWTFVATYDLVVSQFIPEEYAKQLPKAWQVAVTTGNILPIWGWLLILAGILVISSLEYAFRIKRAHDAKNIRPTDNRPPLGFTTTNDAPVRQLTNEQLRTRAKSLAHTLLLFAKNFEAVEGQISHEEFLTRTDLRDKTDEERARITKLEFDRSTTARNDRQSAFEIAYFQRYHSEALNLRDELCTRLGIMKPYKHSQETLLLDTGKMYGNHVLEGAASYLDGLAERL